MIDPKLLRTDPDLVRRSQEARGESVELVDQLVSADEARRAAIVAFETLRAEQKQLGGQVARAQGEEKAALLARTKELSAQVKAAQADADAAAPGSVRTTSRRSSTWSQSVLQLPPASHG
mgnify:CR=1 FL=1